MSDHDVTRATEPMKAGAVIVFLDSGKEHARLFDPARDSVPHAFATHDANAGDLVIVGYKGTFKISEVDAVICGGLLYMGPIDEEEEDGENDEDS